MELLTALALGLGALSMVGLGIAWIGFQSLASPFPAPVGEPREPEYRPLPESLPAPVERWLRQVFGDAGVPVVESAVCWGRGRLRLGPVWAPVRFRTRSHPGRSFHRTLDIGWFSRPVIRSREHFAGGRGEIDVHGWVERHTEGPEVDRAQHLMLWAEALWAPSVLVLDPRLRWRSVDKSTAQLEIPWGDETEVLTAHFDPKSGWLRRLAGERHRGTDPKRRPWRVDLRGWQELGGIQVPTVGVARWGDEMSPYCMLHIHGVAYDLVEPARPASDDEDEDDFDQD